ncbi:MAG: winged helix-turn-helix domain-containing protein [Actinobacteria bacterium]|nr:winged helix-turn-helix domain-containing protein [Actinomycetota bacterium]
MGYGVLGPLTATLDGRPLSLGGPVQRRLLASLIAHAPDVVPADRLIDDVWGEAAPPTAVRTLHSHVTRLRNTLGRDGTQAIETMNGGYRLVLQRGDLDAWVFEDLLHSATTNGHDPRATAQALREALALWRGPAYAEFAGLPFIDAERLRLGSLREAAVEAKVEADLASGRGPDLVAELETLVVEYPFRERLWTALVVALYRSGRQADALAAYQRARGVLAVELGIEPGPDLRAAEARVLAQDPDLIATPRAEVVTCPWKGLATYQPADRDYFIGRERLVTELVARLVDNDVVVVTGPSGSGKSSVVRAGLVPALEAGAVIGSQDWRIMLPGRLDVEALRSALVPPPDLLVIDPMDELLVAGRPDEVATLAHELLQAISGGTRLVITVRGDLFDRLAELPGLTPAAGAGTVLVGPPQADELRAVVELPARLVGLTVEPALVDAVVADVAGRPGSLPLLSTALVRTWERREGPRLTLADYREAGGAASALERLAEEAYASMKEPDRPSARRILLRLVADHEGTWRRRRVALEDAVPPGDEGAGRALEVLSSHRLVSVDRDEVQLSHEALTSAWPRFAGWLEERAATGGVVERLVASAHTWTAGGRDPSDLYRGARLQAALDVEASEPEELGPVEREFIAAGRAEADREVRVLRRGRRRLRYVAAGLVAGLVVAMATGAMAVRNGRDAIRAARVADAQRLGLQALARSDPTQALLLAVAAVHLDDNSSTEGNLLAALQQGGAPVATVPLRAPARAMAVSPDGWLAATLPGGSVDVMDESLAQVAELDPQSYWTKGTSSGVVTWLDGHRSLLVGASDPDRLFYVVAANGRASTFADGWSPDVFTVSSNGRWVAGLASARTGSRPAVMVARHTDEALADVTVPLAGIPDQLFPGTGSLVVAVEPGRLEVVDPDRQAIVRTITVPPSSVVSVSAGGGTAAAASPDGTVALVDLKTGTERSIMTGLTSPPDALAVTDDGSVLAVSDGRDGTVRVVSTSTGLEQARVRSALGAAQALAWSRDGSRLYLAPDGASALEAWDLSRHASVDTPVIASAPVGVGRVTTTSVDPKNRILGVGTDLGVAWFLDLASGQTRVASVAPDAQRSIVSIAFAAGGGQALTADMAGVLTMWDVTTAEPIREFAGDSGAGLYSALVPNAPIGPDGRTAASFSDGFALRTIDVATAAVGGPVYPDLGEQALAQVLGWSPDGRDVVVAAEGHAFAAEDGRIQRRGVWARVDPNDGSVRWRVDAPESAGTPDLAFVDAGRTVVVPGRSGRLHFLDAATGATVGPKLADSPRELAVADSASSVSLSTSPDGRLMSVVSAPRPVEIWDLATGEQRGRIVAPVDTVSARFASDSELVTTTARGAVAIYDLSVGDWIDRACRAAGRDLTAEEWAEFLPGYPYEPVCSNSSSVRVLQ